MVRLQLFSNFNLINYFSISFAYLDDVPVRIPKARSLTTCKNLCFASELPKIDNIKKWAVLCFSEAEMIGGFYIHVLKELKSHWTFCHITQ